MSNQETKEQWIEIAKHFLSKPKHKITRSELDGALIGVSGFNDKITDALACAIQKRLDAKDYATKSQIMKMLKESIKRIIRKEMIYKGNVGISELMMFYKYARPELSHKIEKLLNSEDDHDKKIAWRIILRFIDNVKRRNIEESVDEGWKSAIAGGLLGLSTLSGLSASPKTSASPTANVQKANVGPMDGSIVDIIKGYENNKSNPKGGYNKDLNKWFPHTSLEGGEDTIAYGHKILPNEDYSQGITDGEALELLKADIDKKEILAKSKMPRFNKYPTSVKNAILNALYRGDMGPHTIKLINARQWSKVSAQYLNHDNYKSGKYPQVKTRMKLNADTFDKFAEKLKPKTISKPRPKIPVSKKK